MKRLTKKLMGCVATAVLSMAVISSGASASNVNDIQVNKGMLQKAALDTQFTNDSKAYTDAVNAYLDSCQAIKNAEAAVEQCKKDLAAAKNPLQKKDAAMALAKAEQALQDTCIKNGQLSVAMGHAENQLINFLTSHGTSSTDAAAYVAELNQNTTDQWNSSHPQGSRDGRGSKKLTGAKEPHKTGLLMTTTKLPKLGDVVRIATKNQVDKQHVAVSGNEKAVVHMNLRGVTLTSAPHCDASSAHRSVATIQRPGPSCGVRADLPLPLPKPAPQVRSAGRR